MTDDRSRYEFPALLTAASAVRLGVIAATLLSIIAGFAWAGGWFSLDRLDQHRMIDAFETANGIHMGFRRNHAKGVCLTGWFEGNGGAARLSTASVFKPGRVPVFGRFALAGGLPTMSDGPNAVRSMALNFTLPDGQVWRMGLNAIPVFVVRDAQGFYEQLVAMAPDPRTGKPDSTKVAAFLADHPETVKAMAIIRAHPFSSGFTDVAYNSLNTFRFVDAAGTSRPVRWSLVPVDPAVDGAKLSEGDNYMFDSLAERLQQGPAQWHLVITVGQTGDATNDATVPWPDGREHIDSGTLTVSSLETETAGNCRDINFDPLVLPSGITASDDPLLSARSAAYSVSFFRRAREAKVPSAVQVRHE